MVKEDFKMTIEDVIAYVLRTPENTNPNILRGMLEKLQSGDNPDLSGITATADKILKGYKGVDKNGNEVVGTYEPLDTSDATATATDIINGKTAYVNGEKVEGSYVPLDTSDATATTETILKDYTAYVNGEKVTGTYEA